MGRKEKTILVTIIANVILIILRFFLANISGSIGLQANAWHSFTDVFVTSVVFIGLMVTRYGGKKISAVSKKVEHVLAIFVSLFIFYMGVEILSDALSGEKTELRYVPFVAAPLSPGRRAGKGQPNPAGAGLCPAAGPDAAGAGERA